MTRKLLLSTILTFTITQAQAVTIENFEPPFTGMAITIDTSANSVWQVGKPQKSIFNSAATLPNALVTDTANTYPTNMNSSVQLRMVFQQPVLELRLYWKQKLDFDSVADGGMAEISYDSGATWKNMFSVTSISGFDSSNVRVLSFGQKGFTGTDTTWRQIFFRDFSPPTPEIRLRFTALSDSIDNGKEGWMIDSVAAEVFFYQSVNGTETGKQLKVYPTITKELITIESAEEPDNEYHIRLVDIQGRELRNFRKRNSKIVLTLHDLPDGNYFLLVQTGEKAEVHRLVLAK